MTNNLTTIAAMPQGGGCLAQLPAEKNEHRDQTPILRELPSSEGAIDWSQYLAACQEAA